MQSVMKFLTAQWKNLLLANYVVDPKLLEPFVPSGTHLDPFRGDVFVSLVAFLFDSTALMGVPVPFHRRFEEVNLRFYVAPERDPSVRAVTFIKEIVPKSIIPIVANNIFHENYVAMPMSHRADASDYEYTWTSGRENRFSATITNEQVLPLAGSLGEFITEHYWGYAKAPSYTLEYEVQHPQWPCCDVSDFEIDVDFEATYGRQFAFLADQTPASVQFAAGSAVSVTFPRKLR